MYNLYYYFLSKFIYFSFKSGVVLIKFVLDPKFKFTLFNQFPYDKYKYRFLNSKCFGW
jgi:hypothetical protein